METRIPERQAGNGPALETSLVEWKHGMTIASVLRAYTLETSLVEWKHRLLLSAEDLYRPWKLP